MNPILQTFLLSMTPIGELRLALPVALTIHKMDTATALIIAVLGNLVPVLLILLLLEPASKWLSGHFKIFNRFFSWLFEKTRVKHEKRIKKWGSVALISFVAIPLPITGGWTGSLVAFIFDIPLKKAFPLITIGVIIAGTVVTILSKAGIFVDRYFGWQVLLGIIITFWLILIIYKVKTRNND